MSAQPVSAPPPMATPRVAAGALFLDHEGRVLLVRPAYKEGWDLPGGYVEPGESPLAACIREVREELGITPPIGRMLLTDWAPNPGEGDKILYIFDGGVLDQHTMSGISLQAAELSEYGYYSVDELPKVLNDRLTHRVTAALQAHQGKGPVYVEHGRSTEAAS